MADLNREDEYPSSDLSIVTVTNMKQVTQNETNPSAKPCKQSLIIKCTQTMQLLHRRDERLHRRCVHEVKRQQVIDAHCLQ